MRGPIANPRICQPGRGRNRPTRSEEADSLARPAGPASRPLPGKRRDQLQPGPRGCAANSLWSFSWQTSGTPQIPCSVRRGLSKAGHRGATFATGCTANEIIALTLRLARAKKRSCLLGQGHRPRRLHAVAGRRDDQRDAGEQRIKGYTRHEIVGRYLLGSSVSSQTVLLSGRVPGRRCFPMTCVTSTEPGLVRV